MTDKFLRNLGGRKTINPMSVTNPMNKIMAAMNNTLIAVKYFISKTSLKTTDHSNNSLRQNPLKHEYGRSFPVDLTYHPN